METQKNKELCRKIQYLNRKRREHEALIDKLTGKSQEKPELTMQPMLEIKQSRSSEISHQVNLLTHLESQRDENMPIQTEQKLRKSLEQAYEGRIFEISPLTSCQSGWLYSEDTVDFEIISQYLQRNQLWEDVFGYDEFGYFARLSNISNNFPNRINLSSSELLQEQQCLLIENQLPFKEQKPICIGLLLLYRTLSFLKIGDVHKILQIFFAYSYQTYDVRQTKQYFEFVQKLQEIVKKPEQNVLIYGQSTINSRLFELPIRKIPFKPQKLLKKANRIIIIDGEDYCLKKVDLVHKRNHHVVVDLQNCESGEYTISFIGENLISNLYQEAQSIEEYGENKTQPKFRACIVDSRFQILYYSTNFISNSESIKINLQKNQEYKIYISYILDESLISQKHVRKAPQNTPSPQKMKFSLLFQSKCPLNQFEISVKFNEKYNDFTQQLVDGFLDTFHVNEVEKQMVRLSHINSETEVLIVRCMLDFMGLAIDFVSIPDSILEEQVKISKDDQKIGEVDKNQRKVLRKSRRTVQKGRKIKQILIEYEQKEVFCDKEFKNNKKTLKFAPSAIEKVLLSKDSPIKALSPPLSFCVSKIFL